MTTYTLVLDASTTIPTAEPMSVSAAPPRERVTPRRSRTTNSADHLSARLCQAAVDYVNEWLEAAGSEPLDGTEATETRARKRLREAFRAELGDDYRPDTHAKDIRTTAADLVALARTVGENRS